MYIYIYIYIVTICNQTRAIHVLYLSNHTYDVYIYTDVLNRIDDVKYNFDNLNKFSRAKHAGMPKKDNKELILSLSFHFFYNYSCYNKK